MPVTYLINSVLSFSPDDNLLKNINDDKSASLHAPATRCLQALIERQGEVIRQEELYNIGWGEIKGPTTSPSAYYQCFVNLRKQLKVIGYQDELVITVPKEGMKLSPDVEIKSTERNTAQEPSSISPMPSRPIIASWLQANKRIPLLVAGFCVLLITLVFISFHRPEYVSKQFHTLNALPACLLVKREANMPIQDAVDIIHSYHITCSSDKPVYVNVAYGKLTGIECDGELKHCSSFTEIANND